MSSNRLPNYLRVYRKRLGLSQQEVAFLLGCDSPAQVSRYEHFSRVPTLRTALALAIILQGAADELFAGECEKARRVIYTRARLLAARLAKGNSTTITTHKLTLLSSINDKHS